MCLAVPMKIESISGDMATVEVQGARKDVSVALIDEPKVGDYVLIHAGFAIKRIDEFAANETYDLIF